MSRASQLTNALVEATPRCSARGAEALARAYLVDISRYWRGDADTTKFGALLAGWGGVGLPAAPARPPDAYSPHGAGGRGIRWYACGAEVVGYIPGSMIGYRIPQTCIPGLLRAVGIDVEPAAAVAAGRAAQRRPAGVATYGKREQAAPHEVVTAPPAGMEAVA